MRVIKKKALEDFWAGNRQVKNLLLTWFETVKVSRWRNFSQMRSVFCDADEVTVRSGKKAVVFNIGHNRFRLITAVHYERRVKDAQGAEKLIEGKIYLFYFLTHAEYDRDHWKRQL